MTSLLRKYSGVSEGGGFLLMANSDHLPQLVILQRYKGCFALIRARQCGVLMDGRITSYSLKHLWFQQRQLRGEDISYKHDFIGMS